VASKSAQQEPEKAEVIEEALDTLDKTLDRVKVLYEQYFLGIQKQPPQFLHAGVERKLRDLAQLQIRNTALRYRFATLQQKYGSYHTYWRRTLREIEAGRYHRSLSRVTRKAAATGAEIPQEILASMPKRMREQVRRDREAALALQRHRAAAAAAEPELLTLEPLDEDEDAGFIRESPDVRQHALRARGGTHVLDESDADLDLDALFRQVEAEEAAAAAVAKAAAAVVTADAQRSPPPSPRIPPPMPMPMPMPAVSSLPKVSTIAPSQLSKPNPIVPGSASARPAAPVETMAGPFPREAPVRVPPIVSPPKPPPAASPPKPPPPVVSPPRPPPAVASPPRPPPAVASPPKPPPPARSAPEPRSSSPPPGMTDADVKALYARYVQAKAMIGQSPGPGSFGQLMNTIHAQAPKIMEQYQAKGVDFSVVVKDNQVIIRAKPKL
jgi:hypothetical protein